MVTHRLALALMLALTGPSALAQQSPPTATAEPSAAPVPAAPAASSPWNVSTQPRPDRRAPAGGEGPPEAAGTLDLRIYGGGERRRQLPYRPRRDDPAYAVDVSAIMTRCADGSLVIGALLIGGLETPLDNACSGAASRQPAAPQCDANRWNCNVAPRPGE